MKLDKLTEATILALQGKLEEVKNTIVYDDEGPELQQFIDMVESDCHTIFEPLSKWKYGYFGEDIAQKGYEVIQDYINGYTDYGFDVVNGKTEHANGIGNNNSREIIVSDDDGNKKIIGKLCITNNMYGSGIIWVEDLSGKKMGFKNFNRINEEGCFTRN